MPIPIIAQGLREGISSIPHAWTVIRYAPWFLVLAALKYYFEGARNTSERMMRSKVIMVTVRTHTNTLNCSSLQAAGPN
jgi:small-conductance mechanosensitive channel